MGEFGDDETRFVDARAGKNSGQSPITRASGRKTIVLARYATNRRLGAALHLQAYAALTRSPGARAYYDELRGRNIGHHAALRQLANRLVGILHGCLKTGAVYNEDTAWQHRRTDTADPSLLDKFRDGMSVQHPDLSGTDRFQHGFTSTMTRICPSCSVEPVNQQVTDVGTKTSGSVVSTLRRKPDTNWAIFSFGDLTLGVNVAPAKRRLQQQGERRRRRDRRAVKSRRPQAR